MAHLQLLTGNILHTDLLLGRLAVYYVFLLRNSFQALFPERDCFTLVRPLNDEEELQKLDQISVSPAVPH